VLLLVPVLAAAVWTFQCERRSLRILGLGMHVGISALALVLNLHHAPEFTYVWIVPAVLCACGTVYAARSATRLGKLASAPET
jgi:hypothetical protein